MAKAPTTDEAVMALLVTVQEKKAEIKKLKKKPQWKTNCSIVWNVDPTRTTDKSHDRVNIQVVRDPSMLMELYAFLLQREDYLEGAAMALKLPQDLTYMAYPTADWKADLQTRAAQLSVEQKEKDLAALDERVNKLVSRDQRRAMELKALQKILDG